MGHTAVPSNSRESRAVLFDFDGTMGRTLHHWRDAYHESLRERGIELGRPELIDNCFHSSQKQVIADLAISDPEIFKEAVWARVRALVEHVEPYPDLFEVLGVFREHGFKIGIVSNSRRANIQPILVRWGIVDHFDVIITIDDVSNGKPDPEAIHHAMNRLNVSPSSTFYVGDWDTDVHAASRAGAKTVAFSPDENREFLPLEVLQRAAPHHVVDSHKSLGQLLVPHRRAIINSERIASRGGY